MPISQAQAAGIKVALVDTTLDDTSPAVTAISTDNTAAGAAAADALAKLIGEKGKVMAVVMTPGSTTSDQRQHGFEAQIKTYPNIQYLGFQNANNDPATAASEVTAVLAANPDLAGIFAANDRTTEGAATAIRGANKIGDVKIVGFDAGDTEVQYLQQGSSRRSPLRCRTTSVSWGSTPWPPPSPVERQRRT